MGDGARRLLDWLEAEERARLALEERCCPWSTKEGSGGRWLAVRQDRLGETSGDESRSLTGVAGWLGCGVFLDISMFTSSWMLGV